MYFTLSYLLRNLTENKISGHWRKIDRKFGFSGYILVEINLCNHKNIFLYSCIY